MCIRDSLHAEVGFPVGGAAGYWRPDARSHVGIHEIQVQAQVEVGVGVHAGERAHHRAAHPDLVDEPHVEDLDALLEQQRLLAGVDAA